MNNRLPHLHQVVGFNPPIPLRVKDTIVDDLELVHIRTDIDAGHYTDVLGYLFALPLY